MPGSSLLTSTSVSKNCLILPKASGALMLQLCSTLTRGMFPPASAEDDHTAIARRHVRSVTDGHAAHQHRLIAGKPGCSVGVLSVSAGRHRSRA
jgi:hypothetical protein